MADGGDLGKGFLGGPQDEGEPSAEADSWRDDGQKGKGKSKNQYGGLSPHRFAAVEMTDLWRG
jgi:hypothetical protein